MGIETLLFIGVGILALAFAVVMLTTDNAVHSALGLIANFGCVAFLFLMLDAPFLSMVQIAVYAGAIMVLFLFVIMLLKAEQSSDTTTRRFPWLIGGGVFLGFLLMLALGLPLVFNQGGFQLPAAEPANPLVRFINVSSEAQPDVTISGETLAEPIVINDMPYGQATVFETLPAGTYTVSVATQIIETDEAGVETERTVRRGTSTITLNPGETVTTAIAGRFDTTVNPPETITAVVLPQSAAQAGDDDGRVVVFNGVSKDPVSLVDLGPDDAASFANRDGSTVLIDRIIAPTVPYVGAPVVFTYPKGTYNLALLDPAFNEIARVRSMGNSYELKPDTETLVLFVPDNPGATSGRVEVISSNIDAEFGSPKGIGRLLFTDYLLPVNLVGMLLLVALVGVIVLSHKDTEKSERRANVRRKVSRPLVNVISTQTGSDVVTETPQLPTGDS